VTTRSRGSWHVGGLRPEAGPAGGLVALSQDEQDAGAGQAGQVVSFRDAMRAPVARAREVHITVPAYRGKSFTMLLAWLAAERLAAPGADVTWYLTAGQGPDSVRRMLESAGWSLAKERGGRVIRLRGSPPAQPARPPGPRGFTVTLGSRPGVRLAADYGVFSPGRVDDGTELLLSVALRHEPVARVADIGVGYGALAIGLVLNGVAGAATGSDTDSVALWLAEENARSCGVAADLAMTRDPAAVQPAPLTVCNIPTHISAEESRRFMAALARRARHGTLLVVVHASLEQRYARHLGAGPRLLRFPGPAHVVLGVPGSGSGPLTAP
jgi:16S rRNA G1207 methylase RsmC